MSAGGASERVNLNIPLARFHNVLSWDKSTVDRLVRAAAEMAQKVGLRLDDDVEGIYLKEAESKGARIDWNARAVMFTEKDINETIAVMRKTAPMPRPPRELSVVKEGRKECFAVGNGANLLFDWESWQVKAPGAKDLVSLCQWADGCADVDALFQPVMLKDIDQSLEPLYSYALICKYCRKRTYHGQPTEPVHVKYLDKMARAVEKYRGHFQPMQEWEYINPPFRLAVRAIRTMLARVDTGCCKAMGIGSMAVSGISCPVTVAGAAVTVVAEILAGLALLRILRPGVGLRANICSGAIDLRTARVSYCTMHTHLQNIAAWELVTRGIGADAPCLSWYRDANEPGMQAAYEFSLVQALFSSVMNYAHPEIGGLACGNTFSPEQAVIDMEIIKEFNELAFGFEINAEALGLEEVAEAGFEQGRHLSSEHTIRHMQDEVAFSNFFYHGLPAGAWHDRSDTQTARLMKQARLKVGESITRGKEMEPDTELSDELCNYVKEAASELKIDPPLFI